MNLKLSGIPVNLSKPIIGNVAIYNKEEFKKADILLINDFTDLKSNSIKCDAILTDQKNSLPQNNSYSNFPIVYHISHCNSLNDGDIILINTDGVINILFQLNSYHNSLFLTNQCNNNCLMCSQPPQGRNDINYLYRINMKLLDKIPRSTRVLGLTGGEPTLLGDRFIKLMHKITTKLPDTEIQILTNGRAFAWNDFVFEVSKVSNSKMVWCIPINSDYYLLHDYIVQSKNAFSQTILGIHNLASFNMRIEIRIVLTKLIIPRLLKIAKFIYKNLPFVEHIAFIGLEYIGHTPNNDSILWIDPYDYKEFLDQAVEFLAINNFNVSIYNLPLCILPKQLWKYSRKSISDWKVIYLEQCNYCKMKDGCGGFFSSSLKKHSRYIKQIN